MAEWYVAVGNGAEMRISAGQSVSLTVTGPLIAVDAIVPGGGCRWRCWDSVVVYQENNPDVVKEWTKDETDESQTVVEAGWIVRFHNAVIVRLDGDSGTELTFWIPGEGSVIIRIP